MAVPVFEPADPASAAATLAKAAADGLVVSVRGSATKQTWGGGGTPGAYLSTRRLDAGIRHDPGDLVATIPAGVTLAEANRVLGLARQCLPLDPAHGDRATIGGIVATNDSGPRRHKFGAPRDLIIGIELALADGRVAKSGGRVVKNVAGYDLSRLMCGSHGSLAVITSATFRLSPVAPASRTLAVRVPDARTAAELALVLHAAPVTPSALEIEAPSARLLVRFETTERAADGMAGAARSLLEERGAAVEILDAAAERRAWDEHEALIWGRPAIVVKVSVLPTDVAGVVAELERTAAGLDWSVTGRAALGVLLVRIGGGPDASARVVVALRAFAERRLGSLVVLQANLGSPAEAGHYVLNSPAEAEHDEPHGPTEAGHDVLSELMRAVKAQFDPRGVLGPLPRT